MDLKTIKQICNFQGINMKLIARVKCPRCEQKSFNIDLNNDRGHCFRCHYNATIDDIRTIAEDDFLYRHRDTNKMMTEISEVCR